MLAGGQWGKQKLVPIGNRIGRAWRNSQNIVFWQGNADICRAPADSADAVADGYQLLLASLLPGEHEIMVHVELQDGTVLPDKVMQFTVIESE